MITVYQACNQTQGYARLRNLPSEELLTILKHLVQADQVERLLETLERGEIPEVPKYIAPPKPTKRKARAAIVRSTGEMVHPVGRKPNNLVYVEVDTREEAYKEACREIK